MNLATAPWIPVVTDTAAKRLVSLQDVFQQEDIRDLAVNPPQRVALMRLLICITQAALDGPEDEKDWFYSRSKMPDAATEYLNAWNEHFELYGAKPFMQVPDLECKEGGAKPLEALDCRSPHGGSSTILFDHDAHAPQTSKSDAEIALDLLTYLNFSTGGKVGQAVWHGVQYSGSTFAAPCLKTTHTFVRADTLQGTIHLNLLTKNGNSNAVHNLPNGEWGRPVWEKFPENPQDSKAVTNATETYLGRLVPLSRLVNLATIPGYCIAGPPPENFQIEHLPAYREPSTTIIENRKGQLYYLSISSSKHIWRQLGAILAKHTTEKKAGPVPLAAMEQYAPHFGHNTLDLWVGGLELGRQAAKLNDLVEWALAVPVPALQDAARKRYETGVQMADTGADTLRNAVTAYYKALHVDPNAISHGPAQNHYWSSLDQAYSVLLNAAADYTASLDDRWYPVVYKAMIRAFEYACPHTTPRQVMAFAKAREELKLRKLEHAQTNGKTT